MLTIKDLHAVINSNDANKTQTTQTTQAAQATTPTTQATAQAAPAAPTSKAPSDKNCDRLPLDREILQGLNLTINPGEVHAIMGPNGSGKSTLANVLAGNQNYRVTQGAITFEGVDLLQLTAAERAARGIFLAFQYPVEIPGVNNMYFLKAALNNIRKYNKQPELDAFDFMKLIKERVKTVKMDESFLQREVNVGFSGGEKKRNEILQMLVLEPKLAILDETDSGLDIDALQIVAEGVNSLRAPHRSFIVVTHYQRLLDYIIPDYVHVLAHGKIIKSGGKELALELEAKGYGWLGLSDVQQ